MKKELYQNKIEKSMSFKEKISLYTANLINKLLIRSHDYEFDSLMDLYEYRDKLYLVDQVYMYNLTFLKSKGDDAEKIIRLKDKSMTLDFIVMRELGGKWPDKISNRPSIEGRLHEHDALKSITIDEKRWAKINSLETLENINILCCYYKNTFYIQNIGKEDKENDSPIIIPDYPSQLVKVVK